MAATRPAPSVPPIRRPAVAFPDDMPSWWYGGDRELTRSADALHLLFPEGERFFIRSVRPFVSQLDDPHLQARVRGFIGQEASHGRAHEQAFSLLERDGIAWRPFVEGAVKPTFARLEARLSPLDRLAATCALEHLTAHIGASSFSDPVVELAHPAMQSLMRWHAAEEVEHKSVAFDVYRAVGGGYVRRVVAMVAAMTTFLSLWRRGTRALLEQDGGVTPADLRAFRRRMRARGDRLPGALWTGFWSWLRPGFHPDDIDDAHLARDWFAQQAQAA